MSYYHTLTQVGINSNQIIAVRYLLLNIIHYFLTLAGKGLDAQQEEAFKQRREAEVGGAAGYRGGDGIP